MNELSFKNAVITWQRFGTGSATVLCFHGYGEDSSGFEFLGKYAGTRYSFFAIDLPFHGQTTWPERTDFTRNELLEIVERILKSDNDQQPTNNQQLTLLGFSLGGRVALSLYQLIPERIDKILLLAPDGLKVNFWYWLATQTWLGNKFFAFTMKKPGWFFGFLKLMNKLKLVNSSIFKFVNYYIGDAEVRRLLYSRWTSLRKLKPSVEQIKKQVRDNNTAVRLIYGLHDRIILPSVGEKFKKNIEEHCSITVIPSGHQVLHEKHAEAIIQALL